jgi:hypothetical protein
MYITQVWTKNYTSLSCTLQNFKLYITQIQAIYYTNLGLYYTELGYIHILGQDSLDGIVIGRPGIRGSVLCRGKVLFFFSETPDRL